MSATSFSRSAVRAFVDAEVVPAASDWDREGRLPPEIVRRVGALGYLGTLLPREAGGTGGGALELVALHEEIGRGCSSLRSLLTVHGMVAAALRRWGTAAQKARWLPRLASGESIGAFALSEPNVGSDPSAVETTATRRGDEIVLRGTKRWITFGQIADVFLLFARGDAGVVAHLVERGAPGLMVVPLTGMTGTRAAMLAELQLDDCVVPADAAVGGAGFGIGVALSALEMGRLSVAAGSVGIVQACLEASTRHAAARSRFGQPIGQFQLVQRMITDMAASVRAARLLCERAARHHDDRDECAAHEIFIAKYVASTAATRAAADAVQLHGAIGCTHGHPVERYLRDARVMEIIEGSTQLLQQTIGKHEIESHTAH